jgi:hypothetical protein
MILIMATPPNSLPASDLPGSLDITGSRQKQMNKKTVAALQAAKSTRLRIVSLNLAE